VWRLLCAAAAASALAGEFPRSLEAFRGATPVIDGRMSPGEWDDAAEFTGVRDWIAQFSPVKSDADLSLKGRVKHDGKRLYFAFRVTDDVLYGIQTPRWLPDNNLKAHELTREGWPWFGDGIELLIHAGPKWKADEQAAGNGLSWQMVVNLTKSRLGGIGVGGLLEGEPRSDPAAWRTYRRWIEEGAMEASARVLGGFSGFTVEWAVSFNPCLEIAPGVFYEPSMGDRVVGLNIAVGDLDEKEKGAGNFGNFHHEQWFAGAPGVRTQLRHWGTLWIRNAPKAAKSGRR
jgi:SSS family solute:Na+ symporter